MSAPGLAAAPDLSITKVTVNGPSRMLNARVAFTPPPSPVLAYPRRGSQWLASRIDAAFFADVDAIRSAPPDDDRIGMGIVLSTVWQAVDGLLAYEDAFEALHRMFPHLFMVIDTQALAITLLALDHRLPHTFRVRRYVSGDELRALRDDHGWVGEMSAFQTSAVHSDKGTRLWFSDEHAAISARMLL